jgi:tetratricopeptide (TPR) repeat protein
MYSVIEDEGVMKIDDVAGYLRKSDQVSIVVGAGASVSAGIPVASRLIERINEEFGHCLHKLDAKERGIYGRVMGALSPNERKSLIQPLLEESKINWGHIALACIIRTTNVRRVLTFNFDLVLERSAALLGMHLPVYDFGVSPTKDVAGLASPAIIHMHGQSYGLKLMNSETEMQEHKEALRPLIADSVRNHLTLVVGYSGEADPAFQIINEEFNSQNTLIWLGRGDKPKPHLQTLIDKQYAEYVGSIDFDLAMIRLAELLGCWPPLIVTNPPAHLLTELEDVVDYPILSEQSPSPNVPGRDGPDVLTSTRKRLSLAAADWDKGKDTEARAEDALLRGDELSAPDDMSKLTSAEREVRAWLAIRLAGSLRSKIKSDLERGQPANFNAVYEKYQEALEIKPGMIAALGNWGLALAEEARSLSGEAQIEKYKDSILKLEEVISNAPEDLRSLRNVAIIKWELARSSGDVDQLLEAIESIRRAEKVNENDPHTVTLKVGILMEAYRKLSSPMSEEALEEAVSTAERVNDNMKDYNLACVFALAGLEEKALDQLEACYDQNKLPSIDHIMKDEDLDGLRYSDRFKLLVKKLEQN